MNKLSTVKDRGIKGLDTRIKPDWQLVDLNENTDNYESELAESIMVEFVDIAGFPVEYYIFNPKNIDVLYGESSFNELDGPYRTKVVMEPSKEPYLANVFGFVGDQKIEYAEMPKAMFLRDVQEQLNIKYDLDFDPEDIQPKPGDVIHCLWNDEKMEIVNVNSAEKIFQARKHVWSFTLKPYRIGNEGSTETELLSEEVDINDFDDRNQTYKKITLKQSNKEKLILNKKANVLDSQDIDSAYYGYTKGLKQK